MAIKLIKITKWLLSYHLLILCKHCKEPIEINTKAYRHTGNNKTTYRHFECEGRY